MLKLDLKNFIICFFLISFCEVLHNKPATGRNIHLYDNFMINDTKRHHDIALEMPGIL